nr:hypothetical protein [Tanacetum cinerariifolium]
MLGGHNITYKPRTSVKGQILADFLIEMPGENPQAAAAAEIQEEPLQFAASNNEAEYEALIAGLRIAAWMGVKDVHVSIYSKLVANQVLGKYVAKEDNMVKYLEIVKSLVLVEVLKDKSIKEKEVAMVIEEDGPTWMTQLVDYLKEGTLLGDKKEARKLRLKARQYEAEYVMREIHEGSCNMHAGPRSVVARAIRLGYYWPTMHKDARDMIRRCNNCQHVSPLTYRMVRISRVAEAVVGPTCSIIWLFPPFIDKWALVSG